MKHVLSYNAKCGLAGLAMIPALLSLLNHYARFGWFGKYSAEVVAICFLFLFIVIANFGPSISEMETRRGGQDADRVGE